MKKLRVFETFAGIGAQHKALSIIKEVIGEKFEFEVVGTSEWDIDAILAYNAIHKHNFNYPFNSPDKYTFSSDGEKPIDLDKYKSRNADKYNALLIACKENKNYGSILDIEADDLPNFDLLTYSFPCQDLSVASMGRGKGMARNSDSRSGLLWQIERILKKKKALCVGYDSENHDLEITPEQQINFMGEKHELPKYLLLENVNAMLNYNNKEHYNEWVSELDKMGYVTFTTKLKSNEFGIPQKRERVFAISILVASEDEKRYAFDFFKLSEEDKFSKILDQTREKILENRIPKKYGEKEVLEIRIPKKDETISEKEKQELRLPLKFIIEEGEKEEEECKLASPNHTESRDRMRGVERIIVSKDYHKLIPQDIIKTKTGYNSKANLRLEKEDVFLVSTITKKQDRHPNAGMLPLKENIDKKTKFEKIIVNGTEIEEHYYPNKYRFLTPRECYMLMGFDSIDFDNVKKAKVLIKNDKQNEKMKPLIQNEKMYQQAGNSIVVNVLVAIFNTIWEYDKNYDKR